MNFRAGIFLQSYHIFVFPRLKASMYLPQSSGWDPKFGNCLNIIEKGKNINDIYVALKATKKSKNLADNFTEKA